MNPDFFNELAKRLEHQKTVALVTVTQVKGSAPVAPWTVMAVFRDGSILGTVGGGRAEHLLIERSVEAMGAGESFSFEYPLTPEEGFACGGSISGNVNIFMNNRLILFGAGHVCRAVAAAAAALEFDVYVVDDREELRAHPSLSAVSGYLCCTPGQAFEQLGCGEDSYIVIATRGHEQDLQALREAIRYPAAYIGMIGSRRKVAQVFGSLRAEGAGETALARVYAPVGLDLDDGSPAEIAVSILAEVLAAKNRGSAVHMRDKPNTAAEGDA